MYGLVEGENNNVSEHFSGYGVSIYVTNYQNYLELSVVGTQQTFLIYKVTAKE